MGSLLLSTWTLRLCLLAALLLLAPLAAGAEDEPATEADLPLEKVLLYSSGVGYFEHRADIEGNQRIDLKFKVDDVNDLLKSMVVQDLAGGRIATVSYGSRDPVSKALKSFAIDLTKNVSLADLLEQLRGERVSVAAPQDITGTIVGVEKRPQRVKDQVLETTYLNLLTKELGLTSISFDSIRSVQILDPLLDAELKKALEILSLGRDAQKKTVTLEFVGEGTRPVRVGYIQETPIWKTSYRLVLDDDSEPFLQGWAIVENTTDRDWEGVDLTLVSGRPISYVMNLYQPLYAERPIVQPNVRAGVAPQHYERELQELKAAVEKDSRKMRRGRSGAARGGGAPAPTAAMRPGAPMADDRDGGMDLARGVESAATGAELGELFRYAIDGPVTLARQRSAMLPIINQGVKGRKVSIFDPAVHPKHPLNGLHMVNNSALHLMEGPVTVFDGGAYAGDAMLGDMPPESKRLISYAMDLEVEVAQEGRTQPDDLVSVRIVKGTLYTNHVRRRQRTFAARNSDSKSRLLLVSYPYDSNWTLMTPSEPWEKTRNQYRFALELGAGKTERLQISEEQTVRQQMGLTNLRSDRVQIYLRAREVGSNVKQALQQLLERRSAIDEVGAKYRIVGERIKAIGVEQDRIRKNMEQIDRESTLYGRYLKKFSDQEDEIENLRAQMAQLNLDIQAKTKALNDWLLGLDLE